MRAPLAGIRVVEVANWLAAPSAAALLADLGADVVKVEPPGGDAFRAFALASQGYDHPFPTNFAFELDNRGKRSVTVALDHPEAPALVRRLAAGADVFISNLLPARLARFGLTYADLVAVSPRVVYATLTGYGEQGPDANRPGFDYAAFWARSGIMGVLGEPDAPPVLCRAGQGDHTTALNLLAAMLAALRLRDQTGEPQHVQVTLHATGMWTIGVDIAAALAANGQPAKHRRAAPANPIWNSYQCADGRWLLLVMVAPDPLYWPRFCAMVGRPAWAADPRYRDVAARRAHTAELTAQIEAIFREQDLATWAARLDEHGLIWAPVATLPEVLADPQLAAMGWHTVVEHPEFGRLRLPDTPFRIEGADIGARGPAPTIGEHTAAVLAELGVTDAELERLLLSGVLG